VENKNYFYKNRLRLLMREIYELIICMIFFIKFIQDFPFRIK